MRGLIQSLVILSVLCLITPPVFGVTKTWDGGAGTESWYDATNWDPDGVPTPNVDDFVITNDTVDLQTSNVFVNGRTAFITDSTVKNGNFEWVFGGPAAGSSLVASNCTFPATLKLHQPHDMLIVNCDWDAKAIFGVFGGSASDMTITILGGEWDATSAQVKMNNFGASENKLLVVGGTGIHSCTLLNFGVGQNGANSITFSNCTFFATGGATWHDNLLGGPVAVTLANATNKLRSTLFAGSNLTFSATNSAIEFDQRANGKKFEITMTNDITFDGEGLTWTFYGEGFTTDVEVCGTDTGAVFAGFHDNFSIDKLHLRALNLSLPLAHINGLEFSDDHNNDLDGGASAEALCTDVLSLDRVFTNSLTLYYNGQTIYYKKLLNTNNYSFTESGGGGTQQVTGAALFADTFTHTPENTTSATFGGAAVSVSNDYGMTIISGAGDGSNVFVKLDLDGTAPNIALLKSELGASTSGSGFDLEILFSGAGAGSTNLFFDWNFSHRSVTLNRLQAEPPPPPGTVVTVK